MPQAKKRKSKPRAWFAPTSDPVQYGVPKKPKREKSDPFVIDMRKERICHFAPRKLALDPEKRGPVFQLWNKDRVEVRAKWSFWFKAPKHDTGR